MSIPAAIRRNAVVLTALLAAAIQLVSSFVVHLTPDQQAGFNAVVTAALGLVAMIGVYGADKLVPAVVGFAKAAVALGLAYGLHLDPVAQGAILAFVEAGAALLMQSQLTSAVDINGVRRSTLALAG